MRNFCELLANVHGTSFTSIDTLTEVKLLGGKKNPQQGRVQKLCEGHNVMIFQNKNINGYEAQVRRRLEAEGKDPGSFELSPRTWGERIKGVPLVRHFKDGVEKFYFEVIFISPGITTYLLDGKEIDKADIIGLPEKPDEADQGGLDNKVILRTYAIDSIVRIRIDHAEHEGPWFVKLENA